MTNSVSFDMFDAGFSHEGSRCTFEVIQVHSAIEDPAVRRIGEIVQDIDIRENTYHAP